MDFILYFGLGLLSIPKVSTGITKQCQWINFVYMLWSKWMMQKNRRELSLYLVIRIYFNFKKSFEIFLNFRWGSALFWPFDRRSLQQRKTWEKIQRLGSTFVSLAHSFWNISFFKFLSFVILSGSFFKLCLNFVTSGPIFVFTLK